jgi:hypothetical protein
MSLSLKRDPHLHIVRISLTDSLSLSSHHPSEATEGVADKVDKAPTPHAFVKSRLARRSSMTLGLALITNTCNSDLPNGNREKTNPAA